MKQKPIDHHTLEAIALQGKSYYPSSKKAYTQSALFPNLQIPYREIISCELVDEWFYHGDTVLCSFGPEFSFLLAYLPALEKNARENLKKRFKDKLIELDELDGRQYAANSIYVETMEGRFMIMPTGVSQRLMDQVKEIGVTPVQIDVSEFFEKGGGSLKCMILDLGPVASKPVLG